MQRNKPIDAETLLSTPLPPVRWLIPGLLPAGLSLLAGASKAGKSWLCLWLCLQLARGGEIWGRTTQPQTVLYLCLEDTYARIQGRLFRLTEEPVPSRLYFQTGSCAIGDGLELQIEKFLSQHPETGLVVIDTLQKVRTADPNNGAYASDYQDMSALKFLADRRGIGLLLVHHLRKQGASDPFQQISGSNGLMGAADTIWPLQRQRMSDTARLLVTGRDMDSCTLHLQTRDCIWQLLEEETAEEQVRKAVPDYLWRTADFVRRTGSWTGTATELLTAAAITGVQPNQFTRKLVEHFYTVFAPQGIPTSPGAPPTPGCCASPVTKMTVMTVVTMIPADPLYRLVRYRLVKRVRPPYRHRRHHRHRGRITVASMGFVLPTGNPSPRRTPPLLRGRPRTPQSHGRLPREEPHRGHQRAGDTG